MTNINSPNTDEENIDASLQLQTNANKELLIEGDEEKDDPLNEHHSAASETSPSCQIILLILKVQTVINQQEDKFSILHLVKINTLYH